MEKEAVIKINFTNLPRHDLSGVYIFDSLPQDGGEKKPTCLEDCLDETRQRHLARIDRKELLRIADRLDATFEALWSYMSDREKVMAESAVPPKCNREAGDLRAEIDFMCRHLKLIACMTRLSSRGSEAHLAGFRR